MFEKIADVIVYDLLKLAADSHLAHSVHFFFYDVFKITALIVVVITIISFLRSYASPERLNKWLSKPKFGLSYIIASCFGAISPFCSCSSIPIFIGFVKSGVPMGVAFSFLITSPLVNEIAFVLMIGTFGMKMASVYALFGIILGVVCGMILEKTGFRNDIIRLNDGSEKTELPSTFKQRARFAYVETVWTFKKIFPFIVLGVAIGAAIHGYLPSELISEYIKSDSVFAVPVAVAIGVPLYAGCSTLVPIVFAFTQKGVAIGTGIAFMMAVAGLSFPEAIILKSVMKFRLLAMFYAIIAIGIIGVGYLFNFLF